MTDHPSSQNVKVAVDIVILRVVDGELQSLLIQMKKAPYEKRWAFPGGLIDENETTLAAAKRILATQTGLHQGYLEQLQVFDNPRRDVAGRVVSVGYFALVGAAPVKLQTTEKYADVAWHSFRKLPKLAYDHNEIAVATTARLKERLTSSNLAKNILPTEFTMSQLQSAYEALLGESLDKRNFRKKMELSGLLKSTGAKTKGGAHRPAEVWRFR